ncbi:hypothetical protein GC170_14755 [bacterium]|nr:hypothetical protein [bacterium]
MPRSLLLLAAACLFVCGMPAAARADEPLKLHPENGHYFLWNGKPTILVTSGEHYGALLNLDFEFDRYFRTLQKDGLNHTRVFSGTYRELQEAFGIQANTLAPAQNRYIAPWKRSAEPGYHHGGNKFDLTQFDPAYFERLHALMKSAKKHGIVVEFTLFCPLYSDSEWLASPMRAGNNVNGIGDCPMDNVLSLKHPTLVKVQEEFVRKVVAELNPYDNFYFEICNEPYIKNVPDEWQNHFVEVVRQAEIELPNRHLISLNIANGRKKVENPPEGVSILNFHYCVPPDAVAMNFGLNKLIGENETGFRGSHDFLYRTEGWDFLLAGGGLYNNLDYSFSTEHPEGTLRGFKSPGGGSPELRQQLGILKRFLEGFDFLRMKPALGVVVATSVPLSSQTLAEAGETYAIYFHVPVPDKPKNLAEMLISGIEAKVTVDLPAGRYVAEWIAPLSGETVKRESILHQSGRRELVTPKFDNDIALRILRIGNAERR